MFAAPPEVPRLFDVGGLPVWAGNGIFIYFLWLEKPREQAKGRESDCCPSLKWRPPAGNSPTFRVISSDEKFRREEMD